MFPTSSVSAQHAVELCSTELLLSTHHLVQLNIHSVYCSLLLAPRLYNSVLNF